MKKNRFVLIISLLLVLFSCFVYAVNPYQNIGGYTENFDLTYATTIFNQYITTSDVTVTSATLSNPLGVPLVADLDGDGTNEIIVIEEGRIKLYNATPALAPLDSKVISGTTYTNPYVYDVDGNGLLDIVLVQNGARNAIFAEWNGTDLNATENFLNGALTPDNGVIGCGKEGECVFIGTDGGTTPKNFFAQQFNKSSESAQNTIISLSAFDMHVPYVPVVNVVDLDDDGIINYVMSFNREGGGAEDANLYVYDLEFIGGAVDETLIINYAGSVISGVSYAGHWSAVVALEIDHFPSTTELVVAGQNDADEYRMFSFENRGGTWGILDDYPEFSFVDQNADGVIISNPFSANVFSDTFEDFCVLGYNSNNDDLNLLCASESGESSFFKGSDKGNEWHYDDASNDFNFNITKTGDFYDRIFSPMAHSINFDGGSSGGVDEILTPYGVFTLETGVLVDDLALAYGTPIKESVVIAVDAQNNGYQDLIFMTDTNIFYHDDQFQNTQGQIIEWCVNPCIGSGAWKQNTTVQITLTVDDINDDDVSSKASLYFGSVYEEAFEWSANVTHGTTFDYLFTANRTGSGYFFKMFGRDVENADDDPDTLTFSYSVASNGLEYGDCSTCEEIELVDPETPTIETLLDDDIVTEGIATGTNLNNNSVTNALDDFASLTGLGSGLLFLGIIIVINLVLMSIKGDLGHKLGIILATDIFLLIFGFFLGFVGLGIIITIVVIAIAIGGVFLKIGMTKS